MQVIHSFRRAFSPISVRGLEIKNRIVRTPHVTHMAGGGIGDQFIAYHAARGEGGVGLTILEAASVHPSSVFTPRMLMSHDDRVIDGYRRLMTVIEPTGMRVFQQLWHGGFHYGSVAGDVPWAPSALPSNTLGVPAHAMSTDQIAELVEAFAAAAARCEAGGLHGCELACAHGYLLMQFLSPWSNRRDDAYGGPLINRARILGEICTAIRGRTSDTFVLGIRIGPELVVGGLEGADVVAAMRPLIEAGLVDYVSLSVGNYQNIAPSLPGVQDPAGLELDWLREVSASLKTTRLVTGRFRSIDEVEQVLADDDADLVGMTRAHIADPDIVRKTQAGDPMGVRPCIGCNQLCVGGMFGPTGDVRCTVNPAMGQEGRFHGGLGRAAVRKRVVVIGGGPAGLEAARVAAERGHETMLFEAQPHLGGAVRLSARAPRLMGLSDITHWLEREVFRLGVDVRLSSYLTGDDVAALGADHVIVATGSFPRSDGLQIAVPGIRISKIGHPCVKSSWDVLAAAAHEPFGGSAIVVDDPGHFEAAAVAELLVSRGTAVTFVTRHGVLAPLLEVAMRSGPALARLNRHGRFRLMTHAYLADVDPDSRRARIESLVGAPAEAVAADTIVMVGYNEANAAVAAELAQLGYDRPVAVIGDARSPRYLHTAIHEAFAAALAVGESQE